MARSTSKGVADGLATLNASGKLPTTQLPAGLSDITAQGVAVADLSMSVGTADGTIADVGASFSQSTLNNNFRDVGAKINEILASLRTAGVIDT